MRRPVSLWVTDERESVWEQAKVLAQARGISVAELVFGLLEKEIKEYEYTINDIQQAQARILESK